MPAVDRRTARHGSCRFVPLESRPSGAVETAETDPRGVTVTLKTVPASTTCVCLAVISRPVPMMLLRDGFRFSGCQGYTLGIHTNKDQETCRNLIL